MEKIIAAIISYNGKHFLPACIQSCQNANLDIVVIDNHSKDGCLDALSSLTSIKLIKNASNLGFTKAVNQALHYAHSQKYDYFLLLNQDTEFEPPMVQRLINSLKENNSMAIVSPFHCNEKNEPEYQFKINCEHRGIDLSLGKAETLEVPFVNAACWLMDLTKVSQVGYLNPLFFNYGSDFNYCHRIIHCGFTVGINSEAVLIHKKEDRAYQKSFLKTSRLNNAYHMALLLNPLGTDSIYSILLKIGRSLFSSLIRLNLKQVLLYKIVLIFLLVNLKKIKNGIKNQFK